MEFKDSLLMSPCVGYGGNGPTAGGAGHEVPGILLQPIPESDLHSLGSLVHVQLGQIVRNSAVAVVLINCSKLKQFHCNSCPDLRYEYDHWRTISTEKALISSFPLVIQINMSGMPTFERIFLCFSGTKTFVYSRRAQPA